MATYTNTRQDNCYLSKRKSLLQSIYRTSSSFRTASHTFSEFLSRIIQYDCVDYEENSGSITKSLNANTRTSTPVKITGSAIL